MTNDEFSEDGQYLGTMPTQAEAKVMEQRVPCHCGRKYYPVTCNFRCPFCHCPFTQKSRLLCAKCQLEDEAERVLRSAPTIPIQNRG